MLRDTGRLLMVSASPVDPVLEVGMTDTEKVLEIGPDKVADDDLRDFMLFRRSAEPTSRTVLHARWGSDPIPADDGIYDLVVASHVLEHVSWLEVRYALQEAYRVLVPGGRLVVCVPDFAYLVQCYLDRRCGDRWKLANPQRLPMAWLNGRIYGYSGAKGKGDENWHHSCFDEASLNAHLGAAGFVDVIRLPDNTPYNHHGKINLGMQGTKPVAE